MPCFLFRTAFRAGSFVYQTSLIDPGRPDMTDRRQFHGKAGAAALAGGGFLTFLGAGSRCHAPFLQIVTRCGDLLGFRFAAAALEILESVHGAIYDAGPGCSTQVWVWTGWVG